MALWHDWLAVIEQTLAFVAGNLHLGVGLAVVVLTLAMRTTFLPLTWTIARRAQVRRASLQRLKPQLERLKQQFSGDPQRYTQELMTLYRCEGVAVVDATGLAGALLQFPVFLGIFQVLRAIPSGGRFLWSANLARPDFWLAVLAGAATMALMATNSDMPEHLRLILIVVPAIFTLIAALKFSAALSLYWTTTNVFSAAQALVLRVVLKRQASATPASR